MPGIVVITHGSFAEELVKAVQTIVGSAEDFEAVSIGWNDDVGEAGRRVEDAIRRLDRGRGVLLMTDMFGGTPANIALSFLEADRVEVLTGVNLPMLIKLTNLREELGLTQLAQKIAADGRQAIQVASQILQGREPETQGDAT